MHVRYSIHYLYRLFIVFYTDMHGNKILRDVLSFGNIGTFLLQMKRGDIFNNDYCKASNKYIFHVYYKCDDEAIAS